MNGTERISLAKKSNWRLPMYVIGVTPIVYLLFVLFGENPDLGPLLYILLALISSMVSLVLLVLIEEQRLPIASMIAAFWIISAALVMNTGIIRDFARWTVWSGAYKAAVLSQNASKNSELKHTFWDGGGWAGGYTNVYLVFDPNDELVAATRANPPIMIAGIPCEIYRIRRLESRWYAASFYTDTDWDHCAG